MNEPLVLDKDGFVQVWTLPIYRVPRTSEAMENGSMTCGWNGVHGAEQEYRVVVDRYKDQDRQPAHRGWYSTITEAGMEIARWGEILFRDGWTIPGSDTPIMQATTFSGVYADILGRTAEEVSKAEIERVAERMRQQDLKSVLEHPAYSSHLDRVQMDIGDF